MKYRPLGRTGQFVSEICLGTMTFHGGAGFWRNVGTVEQKGATALVERSLEAGVNFIDTADVYSVRPIGGSARPGAARPRGQSQGRGHRHQGARGGPGPAPMTVGAVARPHHGSGRRQPEAPADSITSISIRFMATTR